MNIFKKIGNVLSGGFLKEASSLIDKVVTTQEEKEQLKHSLQKLVQDHETRLLSLANQDRASARDLQKTALTQGDLFSKRFVYYLAALWSIAGITYVFLATFTHVINERIADTILGFLMGTIVSTIINYFYGSAVTNPASSSAERTLLSSEGPHVVQRASAFRRNRRKQRRGNRK